MASRSLLQNVNGNTEEKETHANVSLAKEANARAAAMKKRLEVQEPHYEGIVWPIKRRQM